MRPRSPRMVQRIRQPRAPWSVLKISAAFLKLVKKMKRLQSKSPYPSPIFIQILVQMRTRSARPLTETREQTIYGPGENRIAEMKRNFSDFAALSEAKEMESGEQVLIIAG
jgi:hypothetical protein